MMRHQILALVTLAALPLVHASEAVTLRTDISRALVPVEEIVSGGPPPDGIPAIDRPVFVSPAVAAAWLILGRAVARKWLTTNPVLEVPRLRENPPEIDPLSWVEIRHLVEKGLQDPEMIRFYTMAIFSGLRTSELIGLKWTDIDWTSNPVTAVIKTSFT